MKIVTVMTLCCTALLTGCGGGSTNQASPFAITNNDAPADSQNTPPATDSPASDQSGGTNTSTTDPDTDTDTDTDNQTTDDQPPPTVQSTPVLADPPIPAGFSPGVEGLWYCASTGTDANGQYRAEWNTPWQLDFKSDQTVVLLDGSNTVSSWWYSDNSLVIQWSHTGVTTAYLPNVDNRGGMTDDGSHCLRELPPTEPTQPATASHTFNTPDGQTLTSTPYPVTRQDFTDTQWTCSLVYYYDNEFIDGRWTTGPNSGQTWSFNADGTGYHYVYHSTGDWNFNWQWTDNGAEITRNSDGQTYLFQINNSSDSSYWVYNYPSSTTDEIRPIQQSGDYSGGYGCVKN